MLRYCETISIDDFEKMELEEVNDPGFVYIFRHEHKDRIKRLLLDEWKLGKSHRIETVMDNLMFYVTNCDIQDICMCECDDLVSMLIDEGYSLRVIV